MSDGYLVSLLCRNRPNRSPEQIRKIREYPNSKPPIDADNRGQPAKSYSSQKSADSEQGNHLKANDDLGHWRHTCNPCQKTDPVSPPNHVAYPKFESFPSLSATEPPKYPYNSDFSSALSEKLQIYLQPDHSNQLFLNSIISLDQNIKPQAWISINDFSVNESNQAYGECHTSERTQSSQDLIHTRETPLSSQTACSTTDVVEVVDSVISKGSQSPTESKNHTHKACTINQQKTLTHLYYDDVAPAFPASGSKYSSQSITYETQKLKTTDESRAAAAFPSQVRHQSSSRYLPRAFAAVTAPIYRRFRIPSQASSLNGPINCLSPQKTQLSPREFNTQHLTTSSRKNLRNSPTLSGHVNNTMKKSLFCDNVTAHGHDSCDTKNHNELIPHRHQAPFREIPIRSIAFAAIPCLQGALAIRTNKQPDRMPSHNISPKKTVKDESLTAEATCAHLAKSLLHCNGHSLECEMSTHSETPWLFSTKFAVKAFQDHCHRNSNYISPQSSNHRAESWGNFTAVETKILYSLDNSLQQSHLFTRDHEMYPRRNHNEVILNLCYLMLLQFLALSKSIRHVSRGFRKLVQINSILNSDFDSTFSTSEAADHANILNEAETSENSYSQVIIPDDNPLSPSKNKNLSIEDSMCENLNTKFVCSVKARNSNVLQACQEAANYCCQTSENKSVDSDKARISGSHAVITRTISTSASTRAPSLTSSLSELASCRGLYCNSPVSNGNSSGIVSDLVATNKKNVSQTMRKNVCPNSVACTLAADTLCIAASFMKIQSFLNDVLRFLTDRRNRREVVNSASAKNTSQPSSSNIDDHRNENSALPADKNAFQKFNTFPAMSSENTEVIAAKHMYQVSYWIIFVAFWLEQKMHHVARETNDYSLIHTYCCCRLFSIEDTHLARNLHKQDHHEVAGSTKSLSNNQQSKNVKKIFDPQVRSTSKGIGLKNSKVETLESMRKLRFDARDIVKQYEELPSENASSVTGQIGPQIDVIRKFLIFFFCAWSWIEDEKLTSANLNFLVQQIWWSTNTYVSDGLAQQQTKGPASQKREFPRMTQSHRPSGPRFRVGQRLRVETARLFGGSTIVKREPSTTEKAQFVTSTESSVDYYAEYLSLPTCPTSLDMEVQIFKLLESFQYNLGINKHKITRLMSSWKSLIESENCCGKSISSVLF